MFNSNINLNIYSDKIDLLNIYLYVLNMLIGAGFQSVSSSKLFLQFSNHFSQTK